MNTPAKCDICGRLINTEKQLHVRYGNDSYPDCRCLKCCKKMYPGLFGGKLSDIKVMWTIQTNLKNLGA